MRDDRRAARILEREAVHDESRRKPLRLRPDTETRQVRRELGGLLAPQAGNRLRTVRLVRGGVPPQGGAPRAAAERQGQRRPLHQQDRSAHAPIIQLSGRRHLPRCARPCHRTRVKTPRIGELKGFAALYSAAALFAATSVFVKLASRSFPGLFVSAARFALGAVLSVTFVLVRGKALGGARFRDWFFRGFFGALSMAATYAAISLTGPGRATLLTNIYPLFVVIFGALFFGERPGLRIFGSLALAIAGAVLVVRDGSGASFLGDALALVGAVLAGIAVNFVRRASREGCDPFFLYLSPSLLGLPLFLVARAPAVPASPVDIAFLVAVGVGAFFAQFLMTTGYRTVPAGQGSVAFFAETGLTVVLGALLAGERFTARFAAGLVLIVAALWFNGRKQPKAPSPQQIGDSGGNVSKLISGK